MEPSDGISALWETMRMKCLLFEPWNSGMVPKTKTPSYDNVGDQVTQERRGKSLLGGTLVSVTICPFIPLRLYALLNSSITQ